MPLFASYITVFPSHGSLPPIAALNITSSGLKTLDSAKAFGFKIPLKLSNKFVQLITTKFLSLLSSFPFLANFSTI